MTEQLSIKTNLKMIYANDCFGKANLISTKSLCGVTAEILISAYRIWHRKWVWSQKSSRLFVVFWMKQNGKRLCFISSKAQHSQWSQCVTNGISHSLTLFWRARLSWENYWWGKASPPARPAHWQLTHCAGLTCFVFLHREMNVFWWREERISVLNIITLHVPEVWMVQKTWQQHMSMEK